MNHKPHVLCPLCSIYLPQLCSILLSKGDRVSICLPYPNHLNKWQVTFTDFESECNAAPAQSVHLRSAPYEKETKAWQRGARAWMLSLLLKPKRRFTRQNIALWVSPAARKCSVVSTVGLCVFDMKTTSINKQHLFQASFRIWSHTKSCLWCDSTCLTLPSCLRPTLLELN